MSSKANTLNNNRLWNVPFVLLLVANGLYFMTFEMLVPTLPLFVDHIGGQATQIGIISGIFVLSAIAIRPLAGFLAAKFNKKYILLVGLAVSCIATASYYLMDEMWMLIVIRIIHGLGFGLVTTYFTTLAIEFIPPHRLGEGVGYFGVGETIMLSVGPMLGILLLEMADFNYFFYSVAFIILLSIVMTIFIKYRPVRTKEFNETPLKIEYKIVDKRVIFQSFLIMLIGIGAATIISFIPLFAIEKSFEAVGVFYFAVALAGLTVRAFTGKIFDRFGAIPVLIPCGVVLILGMTLILSATTDTMFIVAGLLYGAGFGAAFPAIQTWAVQLVAPHEHETAVSSFFNSFDIGLGVGSMVLGVLAQATGTYDTIYFVAIVAYVFFLVCIFLYSKKKRGQNAIQS